MSGMEVNKADLARMWGVSLPTVGQWIKRGCPYVSKGAPGKPYIFDTAEVAAWREEQITAQAIGETENLDIEEARRRKTAAEAALAEMEVAQRRAELIEIEAVADIVGDDYANVRAKLLSLPTKMATQLEGVEDLTERTALLEQSIYEALEELTADGIYSGDFTEEDDPESPGRQSSSAA